MNHACAMSCAVCGDEGGVMADTGDGAVVFFSVRTCAGRCWPSTAKSRAKSKWIHTRYTATSNILCGHSEVLDGTSILMSFYSFTGSVAHFWVISIDQHVGSCFPCTTRRTWRDSAPFPLDSPAFKGLCGLLGVDLVSSPYSHGQGGRVEHPGLLALPKQSSVPKKQNNIRGVLVF